MARPTKLTPEIREKIVGLVKMGNYLETAAAAAGVDPRTLRRWVTQGQRGEEPYAEFADELDVAIAESEARLVLGIHKAGAGGKCHECGRSGDWRALVEMAKRRFRDRWGDGLDVRVQDAAVEHVLGTIRVRQRPDEGTHERVLELLAQESGEGEAGADGEPVH